jgi:hypothetical protein
MPVQDPSALAPAARVEEDRQAALPGLGDAQVGLTGSKPTAARARKSNHGPDLNLGK